MGDDVEVSRDFGKSSDTVRLVGAARGLETDESARAWLEAIGGGETRTPLRFHSWDPVKGALIEVEFAADSSNAAGNVLRRVYSARGTTGSLLQVDAAGRVVRELMSLGSYQFERREATEAEANAPDLSFDHVAQLLQDSPYRIPGRDMDQKIRYRFDNHGNTTALPVGAMPNQKGLPGRCATLWNTWRTPQAASAEGTRSNLPMDTPPERMSTS